jgi:hypothetical protein
MKKISDKQLEHIMSEAKDIATGFPKNLAYALKQLSNFTKQTVRVIPDRVNTIRLGDISRFKLPASPLIDFSHNINIRLCNAL